MSVGIFACWYLVYLFQEKSSQFDLKDILNGVSQSPAYFLFAIFLMPVNWFIETHKWRRLVVKLSPISITQSIWTILFGISLSLLTPNRMGELGGRLLHISKGNKLKVLYANTICSVSQLLITLLAAVFIFPFFTFVELEIRFEFKVLFSLLISILLLYIYFSSSLIKKIFSKLNDRFQFSALENLIRFSAITRLETLLLSALRYLVFLIQFSFLFMLFDSSIPFYDSLLASISIFFVATAIPTAWISDLPVRTSVAFIVLEYMGYSGLAGLISSVILWCINLLIPALVGLVGFKKVNWMSLQNLYRFD